MGLKLLANDLDDLKVVSAAIQDAILRVGDVSYDASGRAVTLSLSRFRHEDKRPTRIRSGLRVDGVMGFQSLALERDNPDAYAVLLSAAFEETDAPAGQLILTLAGGGMLRMEVEGLDVTLADAGEAKRSKGRPKHDR